jgi:hypothetical protein
MMRIEIRVKGQLDRKWSEWFGDLAIDDATPDETLLSGDIPDQAALYGIVSRLRDLGLQLCSLTTNERHENILE